MTPVLEVTGVGFAYGEVRVLESIELSVAPGDFLGIIGPNGSGKTTLLRIMLGLLAPSTGRVRLFGTPPSSFRQWWRLGYVPQRTRLDRALPTTAEEVVTTGLASTLRPFARLGKPGRQRVRDALGLVGMEEHVAGRVGALSVGQQQRVLMARALVSNPDLLILDEPTAGVDPDAQSGFYALLHRLNRERGVTLVVVSHDIAAVAREVTVLACLNRRLVYHGPPADFLNEASLSALYGPSMRIVSHERHGHP